MILIDGKKIAAELREELKKEVFELKSKYNKVPGLTVILIGEDAPSQIYVRNKEKSANEVGLKSEVIKYPDSVEEKTVLNKIEELNKDETIIIEDSAVGVTAGVKAGVKVIGFTAGGHWFPHRSQQELLDAGADLIIDNYIDLSKKIKDL